MKKQLITLAALAGGFVIGASALVALADTTGWASAPATPPNNNTPAPINVGVGTAILQSGGKIPTSVQEKTDSLAIDGNLGILGTLAVNYLNIASGTISVANSVLTNDGHGNASWTPAGIAGSINFTNFNIATGNNASSLSVIGVLKPGNQYTLSGKVITTLDGGGGNAAVFIYNSDGLTPATALTYVSSICGGMAYTAGYPAGDTGAGPTYKMYYHTDNPALLFCLKRNGNNDGTFTIPSTTFSPSSTMYLYVYGAQTLINGYVSN
jgi:hypothetical protein